MARAYCTVSDIRRLFRTATKKVKLSENYRKLEYNTGNGGTVRLAAVTFADSYVGFERFTVTFSDSTAFEVSGEDIGVIGSGTTEADYSCDYFTLLSASWSGTPQALDTYYFESNSNVSVDDVTAWIVDTSDYIRNKLANVFGGDTTAILWEDDLTINVPGGIRYACIRRTAYEIFCSILHGNEEDDDMVAVWRKQADDALRDFIGWWEKEAQQCAPRWQSRRNSNLLFKELGKLGHGDSGALTDVTTDTVRGGIDRR